jgi:hypothetical protein
MPMTARRAKSKCDARTLNQEDRRTSDASQGGHSPDLMA